jgi:ribosomal protein S18 acetylase RimI-like enzyme
MQPVTDVRRMKPPDITVLHKICCEAYRQNFYHHWEEGGLENYITEVFGIDILKNELADKKIQYHVAFINDEAAGFMKLNLFSNLPGLDINKGLELDKIYISPKFKGVKIGKRLLGLAFDIAKDFKREILWLGVIDTNIEAISFYEKSGFKFHSKTRLEYPKFKEELKGMWRMYIELNT